MEPRFPQILKDRSTGVRIAGTWSPVSSRPSASSTNTCEKPRISSELNRSMRNKENEVHEKQNEEHHNFKTLTSNERDPPFFAQFKCTFESEPPHVLAAATRQAIRESSGCIPPCSGGGCRGWLATCSSASAGLTDYSHVEIPGVRHKSDNFSAKKRARSHQNNGNESDCNRGRTCLRARYATRRVPSREEESRISSTNPGILTP
ncbi:hypothetical protein T484DRAFT_3277253 [Baffinella frigidus]|nr:hypothetical protein T484DRAFT_3277253 [Cryptophyta sp. CCMP2293]